MEVPTNIERDDNGSSESVSSLLIKFADNRLCVAKQWNRRIARPLVDMLMDTFFEIYNFKKYINSFADHHHYNYKSIHEGQLN